MRYVYLVRAGENQYKIGVSRNVDKRIAALQTSNIHRVELVCAKRTSADSEYEKRLHKKVREFSGTGGKEWFHLTPEQAIEIAIEVSGAPDVDIAEYIIQDIKKDVTKIIETYEEKITLELAQLEEAKQQFRADRDGTPKPKKEAVSAQEREQQRRAVDDKEYEAAVNLVKDHHHASTSFIQRHLRIGYGKAARLIERMEQEGIVGPLDGIHREVSSS